MTVRTFPRSLFWILFISTVVAPIAPANPVGGSVVAGAASINGGPGTLTVNQATDRAIINWQGFSIGQGEMTRFVQPSATSAVLNRVVSGNPSALLGTLNANGQVFLINPNGILVGPGARIQTQSFIASTQDLPNGEFMAGGDLRFRGNSAAAVENMGHIEAQGGDVILIGGRVKNSGTIEARNGTAALAAGTEVLLARAGDQRIQIKAGKIGTGGTGVDQQGVIRAAQAELKAAGGNVYALAVNAGGLTSVQGVEKRGGKIYLTSAGGKVNVTGKLEAKKAGGLGGEIYVGGGKKGRDLSVANSSETLIASTAALSAGTLADRGGEVVVWSDGLTSFEGSIETGKQGFSEVSGKILDYGGLVNTHGGQLLIDPFDLIVDDGNVAALVQLPIQTGNLTLTADNDILWQVTVGTALFSDFRLTLSAGRDLVFNDNVSIGNFAANGFFTFQAGRDIIAGNTFRIDAGGGDANFIAGRNITFGPNLDLNFFSPGSSLTLVTDNANPSKPGVGPGKLTIGSSGRLKADNIRIFVPSQESLSIAIDTEFINSANAGVSLPEMKNFWFGDVGTAASGIYVKGEPVDPNSNITKIIDGIVVQEIKVILQNTVVVTIPQPPAPVPPPPPYKAPPVDEYLAPLIKGFNQDPFDRYKALVDSPSLSDLLVNKPGSDSQKIAEAMNRLLDPYFNAMEKNTSSSLDIMSSLQYFLNNYDGYAWFSLNFETFVQMEPSRVGELNQLCGLLGIEVDSSLSGIQKVSAQIKAVETYLAAYQVEKAQKKVGAEFAAIYLNANTEFSPSKKSGYEADIRTQEKLISDLRSGIQSIKDSANKPKPVSLGGLFDASTPDPQTPAQKIAALQTQIDQAQGKIDSTRGKLAKINEVQKNADLMKAGNFDELAKMGELTVPLASGGQYKGPINWLVAMRMSGRAGF